MRHRGSADTGSTTMDGFYWLIDGALAGCPRPGLRWRGPRSSDDGDLAADLTALRGHGVGALLSLTETALPDAAFARSGLWGLHLPVPDFQPPSPDQLQVALAFIDRHRAEGRGVAIHCRAGQGRTGTVLAAYLIRAGSSAEDAIRAVRAACPDAIGSAGQVTALEAYARRRDWLV